MNNEFFPPTEAELEQMTEDLKIQMMDAEGEEYDELDYRMTELREQLRQTIIKNNAL